MTEPRKLHELMPPNIIVLEKTGVATNHSAARLATLDNGFEPEFVAPIYTTVAHGTYGDLRRLLDTLDD